MPFQAFLHSFFSGPPSLLVLPSIGFSSHLLFSCCELSCATKLNLWLLLPKFYISTSLFHILFPEPQTHVTNSIKDFSTRIHCEWSNSVHLRLSSSSLPLIHLMLLSLSLSVFSPKPEFWDTPEMTLLISQICLKSISPCFSILSASALVVVANIYWRLHMPPADINILHTF